MDITVNMAAENGQPKIVEFPGGWATGVMGGRLVVSRPGMAVEVDPEVRITATEWHRKGLTADQVRIAREFAANRGWWS